MSSIHYFGIRHHGVGSSKRLLSALDRLQPKKVLIEGASDCSHLLMHLAHAQMRPPVALLAYASDFPECHLYYPFAKFSPEYQAVLWAINHGVQVAFIDLPVAVNLALQLQTQESSLTLLDTQHNTDDTKDDTSITDTQSEPLNDEASDESNEEAYEVSLQTEQSLTKLRFDPIGLMGDLAGYEDGESFWNDVVEQSADDDLTVFASIGQMMQTLRQKVLDEGVCDDDTTKDNWREAFMRQEIRKYAKELDDGECMAVVCGAWHIPALSPQFALTDDGKVLEYTVKSDTALLKSLPKKLAPSKIKSTWIPYTSPRLANRGYGAGVMAPMWYLHLWDNKTQISESWLAKIANVLREQGHIISTASVIEATRLAMSLAVVRGKRAVGFEELSEAVVSCLCFGERLLWEQVADEVLLGKLVGAIPDDLPLAPLLEDLERLKKQTKLVAEAIPKEVDLDLRSQIGLKKSHLLHRLNILGVAWGQPKSTGSRGTFRERWEICWEPEFSVALVENLVYGTTIFEASANRLMEVINQTDELDVLVGQVQTALQAGLDKSAMAGIKRLADKATHTDNVLSLLKSLSPLIHLERYGTARKVSLDKVGELIFVLTVKVCVGLAMAIHHINDDEAGEYHHHMNALHEALKLGQYEELINLWWQTLSQIADTFGVHSSHWRIVGLASRLLYQNQRLTASELETILQKTLSPVVGAGQSARFFEGFFLGAIDQLLYNKPLLDTLEGWLLGLDENEFIEHLPLFCRIFGELDSHEKKRLLDVVFAVNKTDEAFLYHQELATLWQVQVEELAKILNGT